MAVSTLLLTQNKNQQTREGQPNINKSINQHKNKYKQRKEAISQLKNPDSFLSKQSLRQQMVVVYLFIYLFVKSCVCVCVA